MILRWLYRAVAPDALSAVPPGNGQIPAKDTADPEALNRQAEQLYLAGKYVEATELAKEALTLAGPVVAKALNNLATLYFVQGRDADAEPLFKCALAILQKALGPNLADIATTRNYLARLPD